MRAGTTTPPSSGGGSMKAALPRRFRRTGAIAVAFLALAAGAAGAPQRPGNAGSPCTTASGLPGTTVVWTSSSGVVTSWCQYAPPSEALPVLVLNEIDYDQVGADAGGFVELYNAGLGPADLEGLALVFVDGANGSEYRRRAAERRARRRRLPCRSRRCAERLPRRGRPLRHALRGRDRRALVRRRDRASLHRPVRAHARRGQRRFQLRWPTRTPWPARSRGSRTAATRATPRPTGRSRRRHAGGGECAQGF